MTHVSAGQAADAQVFLCRIGGPAENGPDGGPRSLADAAGMLESGARMVPEDQSASTGAAVVSVATATVQLNAARHLDEAWRCLSDDEAQRAGQFVQDGHRVRYLLAHAMLRTLLGRRLAAAPSRIVFLASPNGKPVLAGHTPGVDFSISYGEKMIALAFAGCPVGVDIETVRDNLPFKEIGGRFFRSDEMRYLDSGIGPGVRDRFFHLWTRKEAVLKGLGVGLSGLGDVSVLRETFVAKDEQGRRTHVVLRTLPAPPGHALALALAQRGPAAG